MALIRCKECGNEISDKSNSCPKCGCPLNNKERIIQKVEIIKDNKKTKKKVNFVIALIIAVIILSLVGVGTYIIINKNRVNKFKENYEETLELIQSSSIEVEDSLDLYRAVWYNTIFEKSDEETDKYTKNGTEFYDDFNDSLYNLFISEEYRNKLDEISNDMDEISEHMAKLKKYPSSQREAYEDIADLYDTYTTYAELALYPSGSLTSFTEKIDELGDEIIKQYKVAYRNVDD